MIVGFSKVFSERATMATHPRVATLAVFQQSLFGSRKIK